jgi:hypothetical protein
MKRHELVSLLWQAVECEVGLRVSTNNPDELRKKLNNIRTQERKNGNSSFDQLKFKISPEHPSEELWLVQKGAEDAAKERDTSGTQKPPIV